MSEGIKTEVEKAPSFYSILFQFPSFKKLILISLSASLFVGVLSEFIIPPFNLLSDFYYGFLEGIIIFFIPALISSLVGLLILNRSTRMLNLRRLVAVSTIETLLWGVFYIISALIYFFTFNPVVIVYGFSLGGALVLTLRLLVFFSISFANWWENLFLSVLRTILGVGVILTPLYTPLPLIFTSSFIWIPSIILSSIIMGAGVFVYKYIVDSKLKKAVGIKSTVFLKAFMASWLEDDNTYLENLFDKLGETSNIEIGLICFKDAAGKKTVFAVPNIHPGPFRTVGSSNLPWLISSKLEGRLVNVIGVFHGPSTHAMNLAKSESVNAISNMLEKEVVGCSSSFKTISKFIRKQKLQFDVGCQFFGDLALITAFDKIDTEDIAPRVLEMLRSKAGAIGVRNIILIDAHNNKTADSKRQPISEDKEVNNLIDVAVLVIKEAAKQSRETFHIGSSRLTFDKNLRANGIGDSGIATVILASKSQRMVYVLIDGNNMLAGLRDRIREAVLRLGYDECEVMTTDTHSVDGVTLSASNLVGLRFPEDELIKNIIKCLAEAEKNLAEAEGGYSILKIDGMRLAGPSVEEILKGTGDAINSARSALPPILISTLILTLIVFLFISVV
ncbi:MAG: DUF2070 family protein [Candidatus Odinarchaeota archaeon]